MPSRAERRSGGDRRKGTEPALPPEVGDLVTLSAAIAAGDSPHIAETTARALASDVAAETLYEAILQSYLFVGFPRAIEALFAAGPVLERHGFAPPAAPVPNLAGWNTSGEALCNQVYGRNYEKLIETMRGLSPDLAAWMILEGYGKTLSRPGLNPVAREYCVVAILTVTRMWRQLRSHAIGAVNVGGTRAGVREAIERCAPFVDADTVREALRVAGLESHHARG